MFFFYFRSHRVIFTLIVPFPSGQSLKDLLCSPRRTAATNFEINPQESVKIYEKHYTVTLLRHRFCSLPTQEQQEGILYAHASIWAVEVPQRHFL